MCANTTEKKEDIVMRKKVIAGNWKMNKTPTETAAFVEDLKKVAEGKNGCDIIICVPFVDIHAAVAGTKGTNIKVGAQNVHFAPSGAYTGEISAAMLLDCGVEYVVIGHSERRQYFGETDETVNARVKAALEAGLKVILCIGELEKERDQAIGTGKTATTAQADEACGVVRNVVAELYGKAVADETIVQYGGSMNAKNAAELLACENVDGGLIGGASLKAPDFGVIIDAAQ